MIIPLMPPRRHERILGEFAQWADAERVVLNLRRAYADAAGTGADLIAAFLDAMTYNGGPMPTSV